MAADLSSMSALDYSTTALTVMIGVPSTTCVALYVLYLAISIIESIAKAFKIKTRTISNILSNIRIATIIITPIIITIAIIFLSIKYPIHTLIFALSITCVAILIGLYVAKEEDATNKSQENANNNETNSKDINETKNENENQNEIINKYRTII